MRYLLKTGALRFGLFKRNKKNRKSKKDWTGENESGKSLMNWEIEETFRGRHISLKIIRVAEELIKSNVQIAHTHFI